MTKKNSCTEADLSCIIGVSAYSLLHHTDSFRARSQSVFSSSPTFIKCLGLSLPRVLVIDADGVIGRSADESPKSQASGSQAAVTFMTILYSVQGLIHPMHSFALAILWSPQCFDAQEDHSVASV